MITRARINFFATLWLMCYTSLTWAASSLRGDLKDLDYWSLILAASAGLAGGTLRTLISLFQERRPLLDVRYETIKDILVSFVGGGFAYIVIQGYNSFSDAHWFGLSLPAISGDLRIMLIVIVGASRGKWMRTADQFTTDLVDNARSKLRGGAPVDPPSVTAPLEPK